MFDKEIIESKIKEFNDAKKRLISLIGEDKCLKSIIKLDKEDIKIKILNEIQKDYAIDDINLVFKKLYETKDVDEAYLLCKNLEGKCFKSGNDYIMVNEVNMDSRSKRITTVETSVKELYGFGTWKMDKALELKYKKSSSVPIWMPTGYNPKVFKFEDYFSEEISIDEFSRKFWSILYDYYRDDIVSGRISEIKLKNDTEMIFDNGFKRVY